LTKRRFRGLAKSLKNKGETRLAERVGFSSTHVPQALAAPCFWEVLTSLVDHGLGRLSLFPVLQQPPHKAHFAQCCTEPLIAGRRSDSSSFIKVGGG
jgi:hypothetical protein